MQNFWPPLRIFLTMEARKIIGIVCAIYAVLMAVSIVIGFVNPFGRANFAMRQIGGAIGLIISAGTSWYMLRDEKVMPLEESKQ